MLIVLVIAVVVVSAGGLFLVAAFLSVHGAQRRYSASLSAEERSKLRALRTERQRQARTPPARSQPPQHATERRSEIPATVDPLAEPHQRPRPAPGTIVKSSTSNQ